MNLEKQLKDELDLILDRKELVWFQKSKANWLIVGDQNTIFFHAKMIYRRKKNRIELLKNEEGVWMENQDDLKNLACNLFQNLYTLETFTVSAYHIKGKFSSIFYFFLRVLVSFVSLREVHDALFDMNRGKHQARMASMHVFFSLNGIWQVKALQMKFLKSWQGTNFWNSQWYFDLFDP